MESAARQSMQSEVMDRHVAARLAMMNQWLKTKT
jgi:hypothetical protein